MGVGGWAVVGLTVAVSFGLGIWWNAVSDPARRSHLYQQPYSGRLAFFGPTIVAAMILMAPIFGKKGDPWFNFVESWGGLLAGFLAVVAAWLTIRQMQAGEERAQRRHIELLQLSLRPDRLRIARTERILSPHLLGIVGRLDTLIANHKQSPAINPRHRTDILMCSEMIIGLLVGNERLDGVSDLLSPEAAHARYEMELYTRLFTKLAEEHRATSANDPEREKLFAQAIYIAENYLVPTARLVASELRTVSADYAAGKFG